MSLPGGDNPRSRRLWSDLGPRLISAAVLVALAVTALVLGGYVFSGLVGAAFAGAYREWETMVTLKPLTPLGMVLIGLVFLSSLAYPLWGLPAIAATHAMACVIAIIARGGAVVWRIAGLAFVGLVIAAILSLRDAGQAGIIACVFVGTVVWMTDTGAFFTGRQVGGEKLAPDISPSKTWSGALGGLAIGAISGSLVWMVFTDSPAWIGAMIALAMSVCGQIGDLAESGLKRRFRVKDSGDIIPGHGGLMDRLDSLTFAVLFAVAIGLLHMGPASVAQGLIFW
ncbi:phosphatidate cytidylyltransferase [Arsenicitalea aurantiaca]|uniref:Phosphatidate cytidylyltransferase n=1 Tax=Arsenicitalea aurantiaca TaxID=1783274 RepID=A0A433XF56_9HYPH|nr:phosphatidate cytidylyltransferase [Arsenicitalea aurantiaca]RUT32725.1 phosphatidate cytidylyltransferase [Arsenicitalea aurantiaca]